MKKVLFIAYNFPPQGGVGVQRSLKFVKNLPQFGWQPTVVTTSETAAAAEDYTLLKDIPPQTPVIRIPSYNIQRPIKQAPFPLNRLAVLLNILLQVPDTAVFWARKTYHFLQTYLQQNQFDLLYTTSGPYSTHLLGYWLKKAYPTLPWVADFRDPWSQNKETPYPPGYQRLNLWLERQVLHTADCIIHVTQTWLNETHALAPTSTAKFRVIANGYDEDIIEPFPQPENQRFTILYTGGFGRERDPDPFLDAVHQLLQQRRIPAEKLRLIFIGSDVLTRIPNEEPFERHGFMSQEELTHYRQQADALLMFLKLTPRNKGCHTGKLMEYIALNRPILAIVPEGGEAAQLIDETSTGISVGDNPAQIAGKLEKMYQQWLHKTAQWSPNWDMIKQYSRRNLTQKLAAEFNTLLEEKNS